MQALSGPAFENLVLGPQRSGSNSNFIPRGFSKDVARIIMEFRAGKVSIPDTFYAFRIYYGVQSILRRNALNENLSAFSFPRELVNEMELFDMRGTRADLSYETDMLLSIPYKDEFLSVTIDLFSLNFENLSKLMDYWISVIDKAYTPDLLQADLFRHKRMISKFMDDMNEEKKAWDPDFLASMWTLSKEYKNLWESGYMPMTEENKPILRPKNHFILIPHYLETGFRRQTFCQLVATSLYRQYKEKAASCIKCVIT